MSQSVIVSFWDWDFKDILGPVHPYLAEALKFLPLPLILISILLLWTTPTSEENYIKKIFVSC